MSDPTEIPDIPEGTVVIMDDWENGPFYFDEDGKELFTSASRKS